MARMTSTSFNVGLGDDTRASSRVLRPPGGGHTDIFGGEAEQPRGRRLLHGAPDQIGEPRQANGADAALNGNGPKEAPAQPAVEAKTDVVSPAPAEPQQPAAQPEPAKAEAPKRVRVPPGGFSSGLW